MLEQYFAQSSVLGVEWPDGWTLVPSSTLPTLSSWWTSRTRLCPSAGPLPSSYPPGLAGWQPSGWGETVRICSVRVGVGSIPCDASIARLPMSGLPGSDLCLLSVDIKWVENITSWYKSQFMWGLWFAVPLCTTAADYHGCLCILHWSQWLWT